MNATSLTTSEYSIAIIRNYIFRKKCLSKSIFLLTMHNRHKRNKSQILRTSKYIYFQIMNKEISLCSKCLLKTMKSS